ncbi:hypothetical protein D5366_05720 [Neokomagataea tanensis]|uniref:Uncharacterized protein n=1 Tax=Neokomagataea tanensis TaxID=661191 RepID=A0A4Y6V409_9PROT|nr:MULTISPECIES: hypothetical protein [Neokomagataea]QDH24799.1 hypothetical protein D5366_05720 [Neokomagataea tanensis]
MISFYIPIILSVVSALGAVGFLYLSAPAQSILSKPIARRAGWGGSCVLWCASVVLLERAMSFPAALSVVVLLFMLGCIILAFVRGLSQAPSRSSPTKNA